jgi:hypothetical protein
LRLTGSVDGEEAMGQVNKLHGVDIELVSAYIAHYAGGNEGATVWVGTAENRLAASALLDKMLEGITASGKSGFSNLRKLNLAQAYTTAEIYQVDGPGGEHFFYLSGKTAERVVWLTVEASDSLSIIEQAIETY